MYVPRSLQNPLLRLRKPLKTFLAVMKRLAIFLLAILVIWLLRPDPVLAQECAERRDVSLLMALDVSPSMLESTGSGAIPLEAARAFSIGVIDAVDGTGFLDEAAVFTFCSSVPYRSIGWSTPSIVQNALSGSIDACEGTSVYDAIVFGANEIRMRDSSNLRLFVIATDGEDTASFATDYDAAISLSGGSIVSRLVFIGPGSLSLDAIASSAGSSSQSIAASASNLESLVDDIVDATCVNFRPDAAMTLSDSELQLGTEGFTITFNGASSSDQETSDSGLTFDWTFTRPDGSTITRSGLSTSVTFDDSQLPGENWSVRLRVTDPSGASDTTTRNFQVIGSPPDISPSGSTSIDALESIQLQVAPVNDIDGGDLSIVWDILESPPASSHAPQSNFHAGVGSAGAVLPAINTTGQDIGVWRFRVTATDNEGDSDTAEITVEVHNLPPEANVSGTEEIDIGETIQVDASGSSDPDGGDLTFQWDIIQAPQSASLFVQEGYSVDSYIDIPTDYNSAGTWIFRVTVTDNEPELYQESDDSEFTVLVDAPSEVEITGPETIGSLSFPLVLDGSDSLDPDSPCPEQADRCHDTLEGDPVTVSPGIVDYTWTLIDVPFELWGEYPTGVVDEVFGVPAHSSTLTLDFGDLEPGEWTFQLEVIDGEGNDDFTTFTTTVIDANGAPIAVLNAPARYTTDVTGAIGGNITLDGAQSFDLDNVLTGESLTPGLGITDYRWSVLQAPEGCTPPALPSGPSASTVSLYNAGDLVEPQCQGFWKVGLTVTDDNSPAKTGNAETSIIIGNCPEALCIDYPTQGMPQFVEFTEETDISIYYHLDSPLYDEPAFISGMVTMLEVFHESDLTTPVYTSFDPNVLATDKGGYLVFHWNGYSDTLDRPLAGRYTLKLTLLDYGFTGTAFAEIEPNAIWIEVAEPSILPTSDKYASIDGLKASPRIDSVNLNYEIQGGALPDELVYRVFDHNGDLFYENRKFSPPSTGVIDVFEGVTPSLTPGQYSLELATLKNGTLMSTSSRYEFHAYQVSLTLAGISESETFDPGSFLKEGDTIDMTVNLDSGVSLPLLPGSVQLKVEEELETLAASIGGVPVDIDAGVEIPTTSLDTPNIYQIKGIAPGNVGKTTLSVSYQPPGTSSTKKSTAKASITVIRTRIRAASSDLTKQETDGIFVAGSRNPSISLPDNFGELRFRPLAIQVQPEIPGTTVELSYESGSSSNLELYSADSSHRLFPLTYSWTSVDFSEHKLEIPLLAFGKSFDDVVLKLAYKQDGTILDEEKIKFRVAPFPGAVGVDISGKFPFFRVVRTVNEGNPVSIALDPDLHKERIGKKTAVYLVQHKTSAQWAANPTLVDVTGGPHFVTIQGGTIVNNLYTLWPSSLVGSYDLVYDFGNFPDNPLDFVTDAQLDPGDILDSIDGEPSVVVEDSFTSAGPYTPVIDTYGMGGTPDKTLVPAGYDGLLGDFNFRLRGQLVYPSTMSASNPLVVIAQGNHTPRTVTTAGFGTQTVDSDMTSDENFKGYTYLQNLLASRGFVTLSVDLDEMVGKPSLGYPDISSNGIKLRGWITLKNIEKILTDTSVAGGALSGKIDPSQIYLVGHSRGGEAVIMALHLLKTPTDRPISSSLSGFNASGIKGIASLAPVTQAITAGGVSPQDIPFLLLYGSADGDVNGAFESVMPFRHYDRATSDRYAVRIEGGNHNHFNTSWGYDDATEKIGFGGALGDFSNMNKLPLSSPVGSFLVSGSLQRDFTNGYITAFLEMLNNGDAAARAFFLEPPAQLRPLGIDLGLKLHNQARLETGVIKVVLDDYESHSGLAQSSSGQSVTSTATDLSENFLQDTDLSIETEPFNRFFQETKGVLLSWNGLAEYVEDLQPSEQDFRGNKFVSFRIAQQPKHPNTLALSGSISLILELEDNAGKTSAISTSTLDAVPEIYSAQIISPSGSTDTTSAAFQTFRIPIAAFATDGTDIDLAHITKVRIKLGTPGESPIGRIAIDDLEVEK